MLYLLSITPSSAHDDPKSPRIYIQDDVVLGEKRPYSQVCDMRRYYILSNALVSGHGC